MTNLKMLGTEVSDPFTKNQTEQICNHKIMSLNVSGRLLFSVHKWPNFQEDQKENLLSMEPAVTFQLIKRKYCSDL